MIVVIASECLFSLLFNLYLALIFSSAIYIFIISELCLYKQVVDLFEARALEGRGEPVPYLKAVFKG